MSLPAFLSDKNFLQQVDALRLKDQYIRITVLNWNEQPLQQVSGIVTSGNVNLDGSTSLRRTASLSVYLQSDINDLTDIDNLFSLNKKCSIELGIVNTVPTYTYYTEKDKVQQPVYINYKQKYGEILWFPLGLFIMFSAAVSHSETGVSVSLSLKDKMCLLNGDLGGQIHSAVNFAKYDTIETKEDPETHKKVSVVVPKRVLVFNIIKQLVNHWGNELLSNIVINFPKRTTMLMVWNGEQPAWLVCDSDHMKLCETRLQAQQWLQQEDVKASSYLRMIRIEPGESVGRTYTDFTWPEEDFWCNIGDTVTSVLDKITNMFGNYQYYYDLEGHFVFKQKENYLNTTFSTFWHDSPSEGVGNLPVDSFNASFNKISKTTYNFVYNQFTKSYNNTLNYNNIKNDFIVWGTRQIGQSSSSQCRFHLAIDKKPQLYSHRVHLYRQLDAQGNPQDPVRAIIAKKGEQTYISDDKQFDPDQEIKWVTELPFTRKSIDWREEIYYQALESQSMGLDQNTDINNNYAAYYAQLIEQFPKIFDLRPWSEATKGLWTQLGAYLYPSSDQVPKDQVPNYFKFCTTCKLLNRISYNSDVAFTSSLKEKQNNDEGKIKIDIRKAIGELNESDYTDHAAWIAAKLNYDQVFKICKTIADLLRSHSNWKYDYEQDKISTKDYSSGGWIKQLKQSEVDYYLDFIDQDSQLGKYSVNNIGRRLKVVDGNSEKINCVFQPYCPQVIYLNESLDDDSLENFIEQIDIDVNVKKDRQAAIQILVNEIHNNGYFCYVAPSEIYSKLKQYVGKNPCFEKTRDLLYQFTDINNTISITTLPIYYLQPNTRITVEDNPAGIYGDYIIQSISLPLDVSSTMTINAYKALDKI